MARGHDSSGSDERAIHGRDDVLRAIRQAIGDVKHGRSGRLRVVGEAGSGKSTLVRFALSHAQSLGVRAVHLRCGARWDSTANATLASALQNVHPPVISAELAQRIDTQPAMRYTWMQDLEEALEDPAAPALIVIDDFQNADEVTRLAARVLPSRLRRRPLAWIIAEREYSAPGPEDASKDGAAGERIVLARLSEVATNAIAADILGGAPDAQVSDLMRVAEGLPLHITSQARRLRDGDAVTVGDGIAHLRAGRSLLAERLGDPVLGRLDALSDDARELASAASVLGMQFSLHELTDLLGIAPGHIVTTLVELINREVLRDEGRTFVFEHDLVRQAAERRLAPARRTQLRLKAFELACADGDPATVSARALAATADAHLNFPRSAEPLAVLERALRTINNRDAARAAAIIMRRVELLPPGSAQIPVDVAAVVPVLLHAGRAREARLLAKRAIPVDVDSDTALGAYLALAQLTTLDDPSLTDEVLGAARDLPGLSLVSQARLRAISLRNLTTNYRFAELEEALPAVRELVTDAEDSVASNILADVETITAYHRLETRIAMELNGAVAGNGSPEDWFAVLIRTSLLRCGGWPEQALLAVDREIASADQQNEAFALLHLQLVRSNVLLDLGRLDDAATQAEAVLELAEDLDLLWPVEVGAVAILAQIALHQHMPGAVKRFEVAAQRFIDDAIEHQRSVGRWIRLLVADMTGDDGATVEMTSRSYQRSRVLGPPVGGASDPVDDVYFVRRALSVGRREAADEAVAIVDLRRERSGTPIASAVWAHVHGLLDKDRALLRNAAEQYSQLNRPMAEASAWEDLAEVSATADRTEALELLSRAYALFTAANATRATSRVEKRFRELGGGQLARRRTRDEHGLTAAEQRIVQRVLMGESTAQIASALYLSRNTVGVHLRHIYANLGVRSRADLIARLGQAPPAGSPMRIDPASRHQTD